MSSVCPGSSRGVRALKAVVLGAIALGGLGCSLISDADRYSVKSSVEPPDVTDPDGESTGQGGSGPGDVRPPGNGSGGETPPALDPAGQGGSGLSGAAGSATMMPSGETPPDVVVPPTCDNPAVNFDQLFAAIKGDLAAVDADDRVFFRYVSLTNRVTAGQCPEALEQDRRALFKMLNMLSGDTVVVRPLSINADQTLFRIDLRQLDWDRAISVDGVAFADVWEAIALNSPYAVPFVGDDADDAVADTGTRLPLMFADQMLDVAVVGDLYYAIIGVNVDQPLSDFILNELAIDLVQNMLDEESIRAGTTRSTLSRQDRLLQRDEIEVRRGFLWQVFEVSDAGSASVFDDPLGFPGEDKSAIFTLPNGMLGFVLADANDAIVEDSDILLDTTQNNFRAVSAVSCSGCHSSGIFPVVDEVRDLVLNNALALGLDPDEVEQIEAIYPVPSAFEAIVAEDSRIYQTALEAAGLPTTGSDPVSSVFTRFDQDMRLADAAGDLGLTAAELQGELTLLNPILGVLDQGTLDRDDFGGALFVDSLCILSVPLENQPDLAACDRAAADLGLLGL